MDKEKIERLWRVVQYHLAKGRFTETTGSKWYGFDFMAGERACMLPQLAANVGKGDPACGSYLAAYNPFYELVHVECYDRELNPEHMFWFNANTGALVPYENLPKEVQNH